MSISPKNLKEIAQKALTLETYTIRLEARVPRDFKKMLTQAATITGHSTLTSFVIFALESSARKIIEEHGQAKLAAAESAHFVEALLRPAAPDPRLRDAFVRYRKACSDAKMP